MKYKCTNCGKRVDEINLIFECPKCYNSGWKKEGFIEVKEVLKIIDEIEVIEKRLLNRTIRFDNNFIESINIVNLSQKDNSDNNNLP